MTIPNAQIFRSQLMKLTVSAAIVSTMFVSLSNASDALDKDKLASQLKDGGYVIYIRHASTEKDYADQITADTSNCSTQRTLSEKGWQEAAMIGHGFSNIGIPVGAVYSSEYCRAWQTAKLAFGTYTKNAELNFERAEEYNAEQTAAMKARVAPMLSRAPATGTNTIIVGHDDPFEAATGIYPEPQGVAYLVKPGENGSFKVMGSILPTDWPSLLSTTQ